MGLKDLHADKLRFCANIDVINKINKVVTNYSNLDYDDSPVIKYDSQISQIIEQVSETIKYALKEYYSVDDLVSDSTWINTIVSQATNASNKPRIVAAEAGNQAGVETFIVNFISSSEYEVEGMLSGPVGSGTTSTKFISNGDGDLIIDASAYPNIFDGTFSSGDTVFISTNKYEKKVANIAIYMAAGEVMRTIAYANSINPDETMINTFINHGKRELSRLSSPYDDGGYQLKSLEQYEIEDVSLGDWETGRDRFGEWKD